MTGGGQLPRSSPEAQGIPSAAISAFLGAVENKIRDLHSIMVLRHGYVVAEGWWEPYGPDVPHMLFSVSKSFTSTAIGLLVAEGRLEIDAPVLSFFPDEVPPAPDPNLRAMRVRHLLSMSTGHAADTLDHLRDDWVRAFLAQPVAYEPGTHFVYNSGATYMLSAIVQRITGMRLLHYLQPRLFEPLGIEHPTWETSPQGIDTGGWGLSTTTADIARFGQLYLQRGMWQGKQLVPEEWVAAATAYQISSEPRPDPDWTQGYGYQFWRCRHGACRGDGAFGQFCVVMPAQDAVIAITAGTSTLQRVLDLVWKHLLPAMGPAPLPDNRAASSALAARLSGLRLPPPEGRYTSAAAARASSGPYAIDENAERIEAMAFRFDTAACILAIHNNYGVQEIPCGYGRWLRGRARWPRGTAVLDPGNQAKVAASGAWRDRHTFVARLWWHETPFSRTLTCRFKGDRLDVQQRLNLAFGSTDRPRLKGRLEDPAQR